DQSETDAARERSGDFRIRQIELGVVDIGLIRLEVSQILVDERLLRVQLLFWHRILGKEGRIAFEVEPRVGEKRLIAGGSALGQVELNLIGTRVDFSKNLAFFDQIAFIKIDLHQLAVNTGLNGDGVESRDVAETVEIDRNVGAGRLCRNDRNRPETATTAAACAFLAAFVALTLLDNCAGLPDPPDRIASDAGDHQEKNNPDQAAFL